MFRISSHIFTRLNTSDDMELGLSSFVLEMKDIAFILDNLTDTSLIILDELGRSTAPKDALAISIAVCEKLVESKCFSFFVTHFSELSDILFPLPSVNVLHLSYCDQDSPKNHNVEVGSCPDDSYGIDLAAKMLPDQSIVEDAKLIKNSLKMTKRKDQKVIIKQKTGYQLFGQIRQIVFDTKLSVEDRVETLKKLQRTCSELFG